MTEEYRLPEHWTDFVCTPENILMVWNKLNQYPILFDDFDRGNINKFTAAFFSPNSLIFSTGDYGIAQVTNITIGRSCTLYLTFWDGRFKGRDGECRQAIKWLFETMRLERATTSIPRTARNTARFLEMIGFRREGIIRNSWSYKGNLLDIHMFGILKSEVFAKEV